MDDIEMNNSVLTVMKAKIFQLTEENLILTAKNRLMEEKMTQLIAYAAELENNQKPKKKGAVSAK